MVEYALLIALIAIVTLGGAATFGGGVFAEYNDINSTIEVELDPNAN